MTVRTTLSFTERHHGFLQGKVEDGVFASTSAAVAAAVEMLIAEDLARETALAALAEEIRARAATPAAAYLPLEETLAEVRRGLGGAER